MIPGELGREMNNEVNGPGSSKIKGRRKIQGRRKIKEKTNLVIPSREGVEIVLVICGDWRRADTSMGQGDGNNSAERSAFDR